MFYRVYIRREALNGKEQKIKTMFGVARNDIIENFWLILYT
jgi:hypothetical protein